VFAVSSQCIANPGSVGQPRDRDPRSAYLLYDTNENELRWRRVDYDVAAVQAQMRKVGLPPYLSDRLSMGA
jgi:diadenosine tetraphosphatase ApaH/serine/threonine PP2A family protein phosphatase